MKLVPDTQIADDLEAAAELLETEKIQWCQGSLSTLEFDADNKPQLTSVCAVGALGVVIAGLDYMVGTFIRGVQEHLYRIGPERDRLNAARYAVSNYLIVHHEVFNSGDCVTEIWNDSAGRTREHVVDLFKNTAKDLRNRI
jgi:hypothetical protein